MSGQDTELRLTAALQGINPVPIDRTHGGAAPDDIIDFSANINPLGPPQAALDEYHTTVGAISSYPPVYSERLAARIAEWLGIASDEVIVGNGSTQLIHLFARVYRLTVPYVAIPTFSEFANAIALNDCTPYALELRREHAFTIQLTQVESALKRQAQALFIGRPNSPTGSMFPLGVAARIVEQCERFRSFCMFDEAFIDFTGRKESAITLMRGPERRLRGLLIIGSLTKIFSIPGLRVGFLAGPATVIRELRRYIEPWSLNVVAERVAMACLKHADEFTHRTQTWLLEERSHLSEQLSAIRGVIVYPSAANFLMLEVKESAQAASFREFMLSRGIAVRDLRTMPGCSGGLYRVAVRLRHDNDRLITAATAYACEM